MNEVLEKLPGLNSVLELGKDGNSTQVQALYPLIICRHRAIFVSALFFI